MVRPALDFAPELLLKAQDIRVALLDVDGVMTDGGLYFGASGETLKRFHVLDGHGLVLLKSAGITPVVISGRDSRALRQRMKALGVQHLHAGVSDKLAAAEASLQQLGTDWSQAAAIGDDWPDLPLLTRCALAVAPPQAHAEVLAVADHVTRRPGGAGALREFCDLLLVASGRYAALLAEACA